MRAPSGPRSYDEETVRFLLAIKDAQAVGFTLTEIREHLVASRRSGSAPEALRIRMAAKIDEIDARIGWSAVTTNTSRRCRAAPASSCGLSTTCTTSCSCWTRWL